MIELNLVSEEEARRRIHEAINRVEPGDEKLSHEELFSVVKRRGVEALAEIVCEGMGLRKEAH